MATAVADLQAMLDDAWEAENAYTLREELRSRESAVRELISAGTLSSVSAGSHSQTYTGTGGGLTTHEIAIAWRRLLNEFDRFSAALEDAGIQPTDELVYLNMVAMFRRCSAAASAIQNNYTVLRL